MYSFSNIAAYHDDLLTGKTDCSSVIAGYIERIGELTRLNVFTELYAQEAEAKAAELDEKRRQGSTPKRLHGVVIAIKDVICCKGHRTTAASKMLEGFESLYTASALQFLIDEEAIIIGSCNCDEFGMGSSNEHSVYGPVKNALDETRVPGGSSGGSAVAVQAGMCMLSLGSDTGGSVRQPADFCGITGFKPGYGTISRYGLIAYASSFDQIGIFGRDADDIALLLSIMSKHDKMDSTMNPCPAATDTENAGLENLRIAFIKEAVEHESLDSEIAAKIAAFQKDLDHTGFKTDSVDFDLLDFVVPAYYVLTTAEASSNLGRYDGIRYGHVSPKKAVNINDFYTNNRTEGFGAEVKRRIMLGTFVLSAGYYDAYYTKAQQVRRMLCERVENIFKNYDIVIMPVSPHTAHKIGEKNKDPLAAYLADIYTVFANLTGIPAISVPLFSHSNNMPFGIQILSGRGRELILLKAAKWIPAFYKGDAKRENEF